MKEHISFHNHEVEGAKILQSRLIEMGFNLDETKVPKTLVRLHQTRFYENTNDKTLRVFLRKLGRGRLSMFFTVLKADRAGNKMHDEKPLVTKHMREFKLKLESLAKSTVFPEDLCLTRWQLLFMGVPKEQIDIALNTMTAIVQLRPDRNNLVFLTKFIQNNYLESTNERFKGLPDW